MFLSDGFLYPRLLFIPTSGPFSRSRKKRLRFCPRTRNHISAVANGGAPISIFTPLHICSTPCSLSFLFLAWMAYLLVSCNWTVWEPISAGNLAWPRIMIQSWTSRVEWEFIWVEEGNYRVATVVLSSSWIGIGCHTKVMAREKSYQPSTFSQGHFFGWLSLLFLQNEAVVILSFPSQLSTGHYNVWYDDSPQEKVLCRTQCLCIQQI